MVKRVETATIALWEGPNGHDLSVGSRSAARAATLITSDNPWTAHIHALRIAEAIAEASNAGISLMNMLQLTLAKVGEGSGSAAGFAYLSEADETASRLSPVAVWHSPDRGGARTGTEPQTSEPSLIVGLVERVFKSGASDWIADLLDDAVASSASAQREGRVRAALAFPVRIGREVAAVLAFLTDRSVEPDPGLLRLMAVVSAHVARVIERQRTHHELLEAHADRTERGRLLEESQDTIRDQYARLHTAVNNTNHGLALFDAEQRIIIHNDLYANMYGLSANDVRAGTRLRDIEALRRAKGVHIPDGVPAGGFEGSDLNLKPSARLHRLDDGRRILVSCQPLWDGGWVATHEDVTARTLVEEQLAYLAHHDALTELANRVLFRTRLDEELGRLQSGQGLALLWLDLDRFKTVNDTLGHAVGDEVLKAVAKRLRACIRDTDVVARLGGDEFAILRAPNNSPADAAALAQRIGDAIRAPIDLDGHCIILDSSIGLALAPADTDDADQMLKSADLALYRAKSAGGSTYCFFEPAMEAAMKARRELEFDLRKALADGDFALHYQPIVDIASGKVVSCEALLRWRHPRRGSIPPDQFIPVAEEAGLMVALGAWVLTKACADLAKMPGDVKIAVNVSPSHVMSQSLTANVRSALEASGIPAERLEIEITEAVLLQNTEGALQALRELHALGIQIAMDDFGTGYSSLGYLRRFPFDKIKIDRSFVSGLPHERDALAIVNAICGLANSLGVSTVAEGVETEAQLEAVRALGCTDAQGYLFSKARPIEEIAQFVVAASDAAARRSAPVPAMALPA